MRSHFADLHSLLAAREQQIQHELFQKFQERTGSLKNPDMSTQLQKAISSDTFLLVGRVGYFPFDGIHPQIKFLQGSRGRDTKKFEFSDPFGHM